VSLRRILLLLAIVPVLLAIGTWYWLLHTQSGAKWLWSQAESATGGGLSTVSIAGDLGSGVVLQGLNFENDVVDIDVSKISLVAHLAVLPVRVVVSEADAAGFSLRILDGEENQDGGTDLHEIFARLNLPFEIVVEQLDVEDGTFDGFAAGEYLSFEFASIAGSWKDAIRIDRLQARTPFYDADGSGQLWLHGRNEIAADVELVAKPALTRLDDPLAMSAKVSGYIDELALQATTAEPEAALTGHLIGLGAEPVWDLEVRVPVLEITPSEDAAELPPMSLAANARGNWQALEAAADLGFRGTDMHVGAVADYDIQSGAVSVDLDWLNAHWPVGHSEPQVKSHSGKVAVGGSIDDWTVAGTLELDVPQLPPGTFTIDGNGNRDEARVEIVEGDILGGTISGNARYSWRETRPFNATLELNDIEAGTAFPEWPARLSGKIAMSGQQRPMQIAATLRDVHGQFRDRPLFADGGIAYEAGAVGVADLELRHGEARARLDGQVYGATGLAYDISIDDLGHYLDGAQGELSATGKVSLAPGAQFLRIDATGDALTYREIQVGGLRIEDRGDDGGVLNADISAAQVVFKAFQANDVVLATAMGRERQSIDLDFDAHGLHAGLSLRGSLDDWDDPSAWDGEISRLELQHSEFSAQLEEQAPLRMSKHRADIERLCMTGASGISLCADGNWDSGAGFDLAASLSSVPVDLLNTFVDTRLGFDQVVSGDFHWYAGADGRSGGRADLRMTAGTIVSLDEPDRELTTGASRLGFDVDGDDLRGGIVDVPLPGQGQIAAEFQVLDVAVTGAPGIGGRIDIDLADIGIVLPFVTVLDDAKGTFRADLDVAGTLDTPAVTGTIALDGGSLSYLPIGLKIDEIDLRSELQEHGEIEVMGSFRAGEGRGQIRTRADHRRTPVRGLEVTLRGHNLTLIDVPDVKAIANTDVQVHFDGEELEINGTLAFPRARIVPSNLGTSRVYESEDVVIIAGELPDETTEAADRADIRILGSLDVSLGDDVVVDLGVVETSVTGGTLLTWSGDPIPMANGSFDVDGEILAFGQRLEITEGSVRFPDVPADDPYLRIRAEREIFGNTQVRRAGVLVAGSVSRPTIEAYTTPITTEERALTLLVTGSDFDYERGVGAVDFGTYIAPRVYASYGIGLFDNENVVRVRYDLQRGFGITLTSGQKESGADLSFRFEN
jgi:translocation and assembly module TamB